MAVGRPARQAPPTRLSADGFRVAPTRFRGSVAVSRIRSLDLATGAMLSVAPLADTG